MNNISLEQIAEKYPVKIITSKSNALVVDTGKLQNEKYRKANGLFIAEGVKLAREALDYAEVESLFVMDEEASMHVDLIGKAVECGSNIYILSSDAFRKISTEQAPQGVIATVKYLREIHKRSDFDGWCGDKRIIMLDEIRDPGNLGTILRSAEAFGVDGIVLNNCVDCYNPKVVRGAMGALYRMPLYIAENIVEVTDCLKNAGRRIIGATLGENSLTLGKYEPERGDCIVIGNEGHGISETVLSACTHTVKIPMAGQVESLNAAAATVAIMWEYHRKFGNN